MDLACAVSLFEENALAAGRYVDATRGIDVRTTLVLQVVALSAIIAVAAVMFANSE